MMKIELMQRIREFRTYLVILVLALSVAGSLLNASDTMLIVEHPVIRLLPPTVKNTAAYFSISNPTDKDVYLVGGISEVAERVEIHNHVMDGEVMRMEKQDKVLIPSGQTVVFQPGGLHVMLLGLKQTLHAEQKIKIALTTINGESIPFVAEVGEPQAAIHKHHH